MEKRAVILSLLVLAFLTAAPASAGQVKVDNISKFSHSVVVIGYIFGFFWGGMCSVQDTFTLAEF